MSRGPGKIQRSVLEVLRKHQLAGDSVHAFSGDGLTAAEIALRIYGPISRFRPSSVYEWQYRSVLRALRSLAQQGRAERLYRRQRHGDSDQWRAPPTQHPDYQKYLDTLPKPQPPKRTRPKLRVIRGEQHDP